MSYTYIKQLKGLTPSSILYLGTSSFVKENINFTYDYNSSFNVGLSSSTFNMDGSGFSFSTYEDSVSGGNGFNIISASDSNIYLISGTSNSSNIYYGRNNLQNLNFVTYNTNVVVMNIDYNGRLNLGLTTNSGQSLLNLGYKSNGKYIDLYTNNNTNKLTISATGSTDWTLTLPQNGGSNGYILKTDGNGLTTWASMSSGSFDYIDFNLTASVTHQEGRIHWNDASKTLEVDTENSNVNLKIGQQNVVRVVNNTGSTLTKGSVVYINGEQGQRPTVILADYSVELTSASTLGLIASDIINNSNGYVITFGLLENINTNSYTSGTMLYLGASGSYTTTKPQAPFHDVRIGKVIVSNSTTGSIFINVQNGYEINELHDVQIISPVTNQILKYNGSLWVNATQSGSSTSTLSDVLSVGNTTGVNDIIFTATGASASKLKSPNGLNKIYFNEPPFADSVYIESFTSSITSMIQVSHEDGIFMSTFAGITNSANIAIQQEIISSSVTSLITDRQVYITHESNRLEIGGNTLDASPNDFIGVVYGANYASNYTNRSLVDKQYVDDNIVDVAFSPINIGSADTAPTAASTQYYYQTIAEITKTISKVKLWGFSGTDVVLFGIYRGSLGGSMTLIGQGSATCVVGANEITLTPEIGQNLNLTAGENIVIGFYADGISFRTMYRAGISDINFGITNTANITTMPATPSGTATAVRFACTLY